MDPSKFSEQFQDHIDNMRDFGFDFDEDNSFLQLPNQQRLVASDIEMQVDQGHPFSALSMNLHDEGGQVGTVHFSGGPRQTGYNAAGLFFDSDQPGRVLTQFNWYRERPGDNVSQRISTEKDGEWEYQRRKITEKDIQEGMSNAGRSKNPVVRPGIIRAVDSVQSIPYVDSPTFDFTKNRRTGKWEQVPD